MSALNRLKIFGGVIALGLLSAPLVSHALVSSAEQGNTLKELIEVIEERQGLKVGCIEEIAYRKGFISKAQLLQLAQEIEKSGYGVYLKRVVGK